MNVTTGQPAQNALTSAVVVADVALAYGRTVVLGGVDFSLPRGRTLALLGPSGCGKTTLLRIVAGLLAPDRGTVALNGRVVAGAGTFLPPERRGLGMVFQDYALWPHLSVAHNVAFPLEMRGVPAAERGPRVERALARVGLAGFGGRGPGELSGGQQQRVAIARALVAEPPLVLFDEPLSNLDRELREAMVGELAELLDGLDLTAIYVTHDQAEAFTLADEVAVMRQGRIVQLAAPETLVDNPADRGVAEFLKLGAVAPVERRDGAVFIAGTGIRLADAAAVRPEAAEVLLGSRAAALAPPGEGSIAGKVLRSQFHGDAHAVRIAIGNLESPLELTLSSEVRLRAGEQVGVRIEPTRLRWFPAEPHRSERR
ncbi:MAG TPA: ABC transporter ATP-binding protein [Devosia sp.]|nr:ABC transporter ATP-binding protein [Devosia sp.]